MEGEEYICSTTDDEEISPLVPNRHPRSPNPQSDDRQPESSSAKRPSSRPVADRLRVEEKHHISSSGAEQHEEAQALLFTTRRSRPQPIRPSRSPSPPPAESRGRQSPSFSSAYAHVSPPPPTENLLAVPSGSPRPPTLARGRSLDSGRGPGDNSVQESTVSTPSTAGGAVSARLVSASGPVASGAARWRQAAVAAFSRNRTSIIPGLGRGASFGRRNGRTGVVTGGGAGGGAGTGGRTGTVNPTTGSQGRRAGVRNRGTSRRDEARQRGETQGLPSRGSRGRREEGSGEGRERGGEDVGVVQESSSPSTSEAEADADANANAPGPAVVETAPPEVRQLLESSQNTIALLLLLLSHYVFTHIVGISAFVLGTVVLVGLDRRLQSHADARVLKSRFVLIGVAVTAVVTVAASAFAFNKFPEGEALFRGLILATPKPDVSSVAAVIRTTVVVDLWARILSITIKALLALLAGRGSNNDNSSNNNNNPCLSGCLTSCSRFHRCRGRFVEVLRRSGSADGRPRLRESPRAAGTRTDSRSRSPRGNSGVSGGANRVSRAWRNLCFCFSERLCGERYRLGGCFGRPSGSNGLRRSVDESGVDGQGVEVGREGGGGTAALISRAGRQRRVYAIVEMAFLLYRSLLPVPAWLEFYSKGSDYFAAVYLVLKGMEVSFRTDRLARAACYVRRGDLDRGVFATPEEVVEAGSPDCSICYDRMERPLLLPCQHLFCGECVAEWLERERTCPLCRAEVPTSNPIPKSVREGRTAVVPQIL